MPAAYVDALGDAGSIRVGQLPDPVAEEEQVLVRVEAVAVDAVDWCRPPPPARACSRWSATRRRGRGWRSWVPTAWSSPRPSTLPVLRLMRRRTVAWTSSSTPAVASMSPRCLAPSISAPLVTAHPTVMRTTAIAASPSPADCIRPRFSRSTTAAITIVLAG